MSDLCEYLPQSLYPPFFSILYTQLEKYYTEGDGGGLNVSLALDGSRLLKGYRSTRQVEPFGDLLACIGQCVSMVQSEGEVDHSEAFPINQKLEKKIDSLLEYLHETDPETLKCPPSVSTASDEAEKQYRLEASVFLRNVYVAAIECSILFRPEKDETIDHALELFSRYQSVLTGNSSSPPPDLSSQAQSSSSIPSSSSEKGKGRGRSKAQPPPSFGTTLSIPVIAHLLQLFPEKMGEMIQVEGGKGGASQKQDGKGNEKPPVLRRKHQDFLRFVISNCFHHNFFSKKEGAVLVQEEGFSLEVLASICEFLVNEFREDWKTTKSTNKEPSVPCFCLETFLMILENTRRRGGGVFNLLQVWDPKKKTLADLMPCVLASLAHVCREKYVRESQVLLRLLNFILDEMTFSEAKEYALDSKSSPHYSHLLSFQLSPAIVRPYARFLSRLAPYSYDLMDRIVSSVAGALGSIYEDQEMASQFKLINEEGGTLFVSMIVDSLDSMLDEAEFSVGFFLDKGGSMEQQQKVLCDRLNTIQSLLTKLTTCGASGPRADGILRVLAKFYRVQSKILRKFLSFDPDSVCSEVQGVIKTSLDLKSDASNFIVFLDNESAANIKKESQLKPQLTFMMEQYQAVVLKLSKRNNLKLKLPRSQARDFHIARRKDTEMEGLEEGEGSEEEEGPQKKRRKVGV